MFIRKKAIATVLTVFKTYPDAVRVCFKRLVENLDHSDLGTVSIAVSVFCELAMSDPKSYLPLAPEFYKILVDSRNNWVLIKVLKIFAKLAPLEPRLAKRVVDPICDHMRRSGAKSLIFECIRTVLSSLVDYEPAVRLAIEKVREFLTDEDPNLKYLGLKALSMLTYVNIWALAQYKDVVIRSLSDTDPNVKLEALGLVMAMVSEENVGEICKVLVHYALKCDPLFCNEIIGSILLTCGANFYEIIVDFDWYVALLGEISRVPHCQKGEEIERQIIDIGIRVRDVRPELVRVCRDLVIDPALLGNPFLHRILCAAAWMSGEYVEFSKNAIEIIEALLQPRTDLLPPSVRVVYIHSVLKVLVFCLCSYFFPNEAVSLYLSTNGLDPEVEDSISERDFQNKSDLAMGNDDFNPRISSQSLEGITDENDRDKISTPEPSSFSASLKNGLFTYESIVYLFDIIKISLRPLLGSHEVEILERARNILGLFELVEQDLCDTSNQKGEKLDTENSKNAEIVKMMHAAFSEELGLVSMTAQEKVQIPEGLVLVENLDELETICADIELPTCSSFSLLKPRFEEKPVVSSVSYVNEDQLEPASESTSLLTEHRKRHGLYYLPSDTKETTSFEYPPANERKLSLETSGDVDELVKLTEQSLSVKKKSKQTKPRPVVVKLDDDIGIRIKKPEAKDDSISGLVRDVLLGNEAKLLDKPSMSKKKGKEKVNPGLESTENMARVDNAESENLSRKSKHRSNGKERKHRSSGNNIEEREKKSKKDKKRSGHGQGKNEGRQRADGGVDLVPQTPVIPDFLL